VFLTGGAYTEKQNTIASRRAELVGTSMLFVFSKEERAWSAGIQAQNQAAAQPAANWMFKEYEPGAHGTQMFASRPETQDDVAEALTTMLQR
jgi:hypothetical protein